MRQCSIGLVGRLLAWLAGALGVAGVAKALRQRPQPEAEPGPDPRAEELRRRLDEARSAAVEPIDEAPAPAPAPARTREGVHAQARAAIDEMKRSGADEGGDAPGEAARDA
jgi:hypothetical protein